jgi:hypothetical protein
MSKKDYQLIATSIKVSFELMKATGNEAAAYGIDHAAHALARTLEFEGGYNANGNRKFKIDVFLKACGMEVKS